ncbi:MAG: hypothetical protein HOG89_00190 [Candidatus Peribacter sp.]|jgi:lysophospholipase L1-like esterase|nr:hypothetical protein [Candidatus Peribacter sp.]MBT4392748.1 hypothetical protein [Candidatus Peribacter sp.]MBT4600635.1 hypothetical protein [Candidatus Peribacter sp.]MBT5148696.1 hypothetical protein [Candidatus Peribacter sp.]MBT5637709.1 hypothetical protein [Candidatus Peribacter sp.]
MKKRFIFAFVSIVLPVLVALLLGEAYIRYTNEYVTPEILRSKSLQYSPSLFTRHVFATKEQHIEDKGWFINNRGYRGRDFSLKKDEGTTRVIVYGGSAVFDQEMPNGKDWPHRLESSLQEKGITNIEVINAGIPGHASFDSFGRLFAEGHLLDPDYVVLYNGWNDMKYFSDGRSLLRIFKPYNKKLDPRIEYRGVLDQVLPETSQLYVYLRGPYINWKFRIGSEGIIPTGESVNVFDNPWPQQYRVNAEMFVDLARNIDAVPILVTQARLVSQKNTEEEKALIKYDYVRMDHETLVQAFETLDEILREVASHKGIPIVEASKEMSGNSEYFTDHVHFTEAGSAEITSIISEYLHSLITE